MSLSNVFSGEASVAQPMGGVPLVHYWEMVWNNLHRSGWRLGHTTWTHPDTGALRHMVCAQRGEVVLKRSAPTMTQAVQAIEQAASCGEF